jgi:hypothetical protein
VNSAVDAHSQWMLRTLGTSNVCTEPFTHWQFNQVFPPATLEELVALPLKAPDVKYEKGTREYNNSDRTYFNADTCAQFQIAETVTGMFQAAEIVSGIEKLCGINLDGSYLRIEYAQDQEGFWLEPHTDIRVKLLSMLIYLSCDPATTDLGTDIYDKDRRLVRRMPFIPNQALVFVPGNDTWHGFEKRPIKGVRKTLIVNYVTNEWRARSELASPEMPVRSKYTAGEVRQA